MLRSFAISLDYLTPLNAEDVKIFRQEFLAREYTDEQGYGFRNVILDNGYLSATLVKRTPILIPQFDFETGQIVEQKIFLYSEIEFALDAAFQLLEVFGPAKNAPKVRAVLRPLLRPETRLFSVNLAPAEVLPKLTKGTVQLSVDRLTVNNFQHREGIIGKYEMKLAKSEWAIDIINKYAHDVTKASLLIATDGLSEFALHISRRSRLTIKCEEEQFNNVFLFLKSVLFEER